MADSAAPASALAPPRRSRGRIIGWIVAVVILLLIAAVAWVAIRGLLARDHLERAIPLASTLQGQILAGDSVGAGETFDRFDSEASSAAALTSDPIWRAAEIVPFAGPNLAAVRELAAVVDDVSDDAVGPLVAVAGGIRLDDFKPVDGAIALQPIVDAQPSISAAADAVSAADERVERIDADGTLSPVRDAVDRLRTAVGDASDALGSVDRAARLVPAMLGADGPRNYLILFQNPAELRSAGGIPGALALLRTEGGRMELVQQASSADFPRYPAPVIELPADTENIYGDIAGRFIQNTTVMPQFPISGPLAREMWRQQFGTEVDGVLSVDPVALSYLLEATGPITLATGDVLSADNAVQLLLVDVYERYERPLEQDVFFAEAASSVFSALTTGDLEPAALISALGRAGEERRVLVWSARDEDQQVLADTTLAGPLPVSDAETQRFGVYLNDATASKMGTYLDASVEIGQASCRDDGLPFYQVSLTLTNNAPADAATTLPEYVTAGDSVGVGKGNIRLQALVYGPTTTSNLGLLQDGQDAAFQPTFDSGHPVSAVVVELAPGQSTVLDYGFLGAEPFAGEVATEVTPAVNAIETQTVDIACDMALR